MKEQLLISIKTFMSFSENCRNTEKEHLVGMFIKNMGLMVLQNYCSHVILELFFQKYNLFAFLRNIRLLIHPFSKKISQKENQKENPRIFMC